MPYVKTQPQLQRKGAAFFTSTSSQSISAVGTDLSYSFENVRYNNATDKIIKINNGMITLKQGYVYRIQAEVLASSTTAAFEINVSIVNESGTAYPSTINSGGLTPTSSVHGVPFAIASGVVDASDGDKNVKLRVSYLTSGVTVTVANNSIRVYVEVLEAYTPQTVSVLNCTKAVVRQTSSSDPAIDALTGGKYLILGGSAGSSMAIEQRPDLSGVQNIGFNCHVTSGNYYFSRGVNNKYAVMLNTNTDYDNGFYIYATSTKGNEGESITWDYSVFAVIRSTNTFRSPLIYNATTSNGANVYVDTDGKLYRSTSSQKYKTDIEPIQADYAKKIYELRPVWYRSACEEDRKDWSWYGLIAEEVAKVEPRLCTYNKEGEPEGVDYARLSVLLLKEIQLMREELDELKNKISLLEGKNGKTEN